MNPAQYFDHAATTPLDPRVFDAMLPYLREGFGNAHSIHAWGRAAMDAVDVARGHVAALLGAEDPAQIVFTSGATESNNWVARAFPDLVASPFEHSSMRVAANRFAAGTIQGDLSRHYRFVSWISVQNETGQIFDLQDVASKAEMLHSDVTQALGKIPIDLACLDYASMSAHKLGGPLGVGALYQREYVPEPLLVGGGQEQGARSGTLNVPGIVGFGEACRLAADEREARYESASALRDVLLEELQAVPDWEVNGAPPFSPFIVNLAFAGVLAEALVVDLDAEGFAVSSGSACSAASTEPSPALLAYGYPEERVRSSLRISFGNSNTKESTRALCRALRQSVARLRKMKG
jgi:cysteine desulfurase